jgi:hypothetical protein
MVADKPQVYHKNFASVQSFVRCTSRSGGQLRPVKATSRDLVTRNYTMVSTSKIALSLAIILGAASGAMAATKHPVHHRVAVERQVAGANAYGYANSGYTAARSNEPSYMAIQSQDFREQN